MEMALELNSRGFEELSEQELFAVDGGATSPYPSGWAYVGQKIAGAFNMIVDAFKQPGNGYLETIKKRDELQGWNYGDLIPHA